MAFLPHNAKLTAFVWTTVLGVLASCGRQGGVSATQAFNVDFFAAPDLPNKTLSLTFDDGPGEQTDELRRYLKSQGIAATFFLIGQNIAGHEDELALLRDDGHLIANHTFTHPHLPQSPDPVGEIMRTDALIAPYVTGNMFLFRAPYSDWVPQLAPRLNASPAAKYVGPIYFDVDGADWSCWSDENMTVEQCGQRYLSQSIQVQRGIVILHDNARGHSLEMLRWLVPRWKDAGFQFARLDSGPNINGLLRQAGGDPIPRAR